MAGVGFQFRKPLVILMALPGAEILLLEGETIAPIDYHDVEHVRITRAFLDDPESFLRRL